MKLLRILAVLALAIAIPGVYCDRRETEKQILTSLFDPEKYDPKIRAYGNQASDPTNVTVNFYVRSITSIDDKSMNYQIQLTFRMQWLDTRLVYSDKTEGHDFNYLTLQSSLDTIWIPDLFFSNELEGHTHNILKPNIYIRLFPDGQVLYSGRISLKLSCPMIVKLFPFDTQQCSIRMASYGFTTADLMFNWKKYDPVQITPDLHLPRFALEQFTTDYCDAHTNTGVYSCLRVDMKFRREFYYYLIQIYIPSIMFVLASWLSFWVSSRHGGTGRLLFSLLILLVLAMGTALISTTFPAVSYTKAIDVWTGTCLTFVLGSLVIGIIVAYIKGNEEEKEAKEDSIPTIKSISPREITNQFSYYRTSNKIDIAARIFYPLLFLCFNIFYWSAYQLV